MKIRDRSAMPFGTGRLIPVLPLLFLIVSCSGLSAFFGPEIVEPTNPSGPIIWRHYATGDDPVKTMALQGDDLWMGTMKGIIRYNARRNEYEIFTPKNTDGGLISRGIYMIAVDPKGDKWIGTYGGGLSRFDGKTWKRFSVADGLGDNWVYDIEFDASGRMWIATWNGVTVYDGRQFKTYTVKDGLADKWVYSIALDQDGVFWFGTEAGISRFDGTRWKTFTHRDGLGAAIEGDSARKEVFSPVPFAGRSEGYGETEAGMSRLEHHMTAGKQTAGSNPDFIIASVVDRDNVKWFGTWGAGVSRFDGAAWTNYTTENGLGGNYIFALGLDREGRVWAGTNGGASWFDGSRWRTIKDSDGLRDNNVLSIFFDKRGFRWFGTMKGLSVFRGSPPS